MKLINKNLYNLSHIVRISRSGDTIYIKTNIYHPELKELLEFRERFAHVEDAQWEFEQLIKGL